MLTSDEVKLCYVALLGREAEDPQVVEDKRVFEDLDSLIYDMASSAEFIEKHAAALAEYFGREVPDLATLKNDSLIIDTSKI